MLVPIPNWYPTRLELPEVVFINGSVIDQDILGQLPTACIGDILKSAVQKQSAESAEIPTIGLGQVIIGAEDPFGSAFDTAQVFAPVFGRMLYAGLRWNL